jgi:uncharacterized membrane protein
MKTPIFRLSGVCASPWSKTKANRQTMIKKLWRLGALYLVPLNLVLGVTPAGAAQALNFRSIDVPGATATRARGINAKRDVVGIYHVGASFYGFLLSNGTLTTIEHPEGIGRTQAWGISSTGDVVGLIGNEGSETDEEQTHGFVRHPDGSFSPLDFPDELLPPSYPRPIHTMAIKITSTGKVVGCFHHHFSDFLTTMHGYTFEGGNFEPPFPLLASMHNGITPDGRMIAGVVFQTMTQSHAYLVTDGVTQIIDPPGSISAGAWDINPSGEIAGFFTDSANRTHGFLLSKGAYTVIDFPGNDVVATQVRGINPQGDVVGQYVDSRGLHGFVATRNQGQGHSPVNP